MQINSLYESLRSGFSLLKRIYGITTDKSAKTQEGKGKEEDNLEKALALIGTNVLDCHLTMNKRAESAQDLWKSFEEFKAKSNVRRLLLRQQLSRLELGHNEPIHKYLARALCLTLQQ